MKAGGEHPLSNTLAFRQTAELTIRGGGKPYSNMALMPTKQNGPAARSFATDAHDCIMVRIKPSYRIQVCGTKMRPIASSPRILKQTEHRPDAELCKVPAAVHHRSACSGVKACPWLEQGALRNTSDARR